MDAPKGKVVMFDYNNFDKNDPLKSLKTVIPEHPKNPIASEHGVSVADNKMIVTYLVDASDSVKIFDFNVPA